ncbi:MAG: hypothetical protein ABL931_21300 [Usitatibacteraceae bacterium]
MRTYPSNSPQAAARIVALAMLADGHVCKTELDALERLDVHAQLGLQPAQLHDVVHAVCEDLLCTSHQNWQAACRIDDATLAQLLAEIDDPSLQVTVLHLCAAVAVADEQMSAGEISVLTAAFAQWKLADEVFNSRSARPERAHV